MRIIYIANDGKEFDDEYECANYEFKNELQNLDSIKLYDSAGNELKDPMRESTYNTVHKIIVHSDEEIVELHAVAEYTGFHAYYDIKDVGTWIFYTSEDRFIKSTDVTFVKELSDKYVVELNSYHEESDHEYADETLCNLLLDLGYIDAVVAYKKIPK